MMQQTHGESGLETNEGALVARILAGEPRLFATLVERHQRRLYWGCLRLLDDPDEADDAVQEAFVRAYAHLKDFDSRYPFYPWLYRIARNRCLNVLRRRKLWGLVSFQDPNRAPVLAGPDRAEGVAEERELAIALTECRQALPRNQRECFDLRHADDLSYEEISGALGIPIGTVMSRLARAREKMRACLAAKGHGR